MSVVCVLFALAVQAARAEDGQSEASPAPGRGLAAEASVLRVAVPWECPDMDFLNNRLFVSYDTAENGKMMYKLQVLSTTIYLYYDLDCDGSGPSFGPKWIISPKQPYPYSRDLDYDGQCLSRAELRWESESPSPPHEATWTGLCSLDPENSTFSPVTLTFTPVPMSTSTPMPMQTTSPTSAPTATTTTTATTDSSAHGIGSTMGIVFAFVVICGGCGYGFYRWWSRTRAVGADKSITEQHPVVVQAAPTTASGVAIVVVDAESIMETGGMADEEASVASVSVQHKSIMETGGMADEEASVASVSAQHTCSLQ